MLGIAWESRASAALFNTVFNRSCGYPEAVVWDIALRGT